MFSAAHALAGWLSWVGPGLGAPASPSVAVAPVELRGVEPGTVPAERVDQAIIEGLGRGEIETEALVGACADEPCWAQLAAERGRSHLLLVEIEREGPDHHVRLRVFDVERGEIVATTGSTCEICGEDEVIATASDMAAQLVPRIERLRPRPSRLVLQGQPAGATVELDGEVVGVLPWEGEVRPGVHQVRVSHEGYVGLHRELEVEPGLEEITALVLVRSPPPIDRPDRRLTTAGGSLVGVGLVGVGLGAGLFVLDGRPFRRDCAPVDVDVNGRCPRMYEATAPAVVSVVVGGAALATGVALLVRALRRGRVPSSRASLAPTRSGFALGLRF